MPENEDFDGAASAVAQRYGRLADMHEVASLLLAGLDDLGLHEAAAYVSLARRRIRDQHPELAMAATDESQPGKPVD